MVKKARRKAARSKPSSGATEKDRKPRDRARYKCPGRLAKLIELNRSIPADSDLPTSEQVRAEVGNQLDQTEDVGLWLEHFAERVFDECFKYFPEQAINDILHKYRRAGPDERSEEALAKAKAVADWYDNFVYFRRLLKAIAVYFQFEREYKTLEEGRRQLMAYINRPPIPTAGVQLASAGSEILSFRSVPFVNALEGVNGDRIRECEICRRIYWAVRKDARYCSLECGRRLRQRDYRNLTPQQKLARKQQRIKNREHAERQASLKKHKSVLDEMHNKYKNKDGKRDGHL